MHRISIEPDKEIGDWSEPIPLGQSLSPFNLNFLDKMDRPVGIDGEIRIEFKSEALKFVYMDFYNPNAPPSFAVSTYCDFL